MKIAFIYDIAYPWHTGGIEQMMSDEARELAKENEVHFFTLRWPGMEKDFIKDNIHYHAGFPMTESKLYKNGRRSISEAQLFALHSLNIFKYRFDMVVTEVFPVLHLPIVRFYCMANRSKLVLRVAEAWRKEYWKEYLGDLPGSIASMYFGFAMKAEATYITLSEQAKLGLEEFGIPASKVRVFSPVLSSNEISKARHRFKSLNSKQILFSGRLIKEKRVDKWLNILKSICDSDDQVRGIIVGEGAELEKLRHLSKKLNLNGKVEIRPFYKDKQMLYKTMMESGIMLHMSEREGLSIVALESIALGTPVILPDYTPIPKEVKDMCVIVRESDIPSRIMEMLNTGDKKSFVHNTKNLGMFSLSSISSFYKEIYGEWKFKNHSNK